MERIDPTVTVHILNNEAAVNEHILLLLVASPPFVAFDLEYGQLNQNGIPVERRVTNVDVVQLSSGSNVFLIHLAAFGQNHGKGPAAYTSLILTLPSGIMPLTLQVLLLSPNIRKVGNNIRGVSSRH